ncbi:MAG: ATP-binding protein, partial [Streptosporangiaceae bacterium]
MAQPMVSPAMVGRRDELAELTSALDAAREGECVTVLLGGEAGVGKTRLVTEFATQAALSGTRALLGQCVELGRDGLPYAPISGVLRSMVAQLGVDEVLELAGAARPALAGLLPELGAHAPDGGDGRGRLFDGVT